jgi:hypothetical protein
MINHQDLPINGFTGRNEQEPLIRATGHAGIACVINIYYGGKLNNKIASQLLALWLQNNTPCYDDTIRL